MARAKIEHVCTDCGAAHPKWAGQCSSCGQWNTLVEEFALPTDAAVIAPASSSSRLIGEIDPLVGRPVPPASTNSTGCWVAAWFPARSPCSAASRASARARSCCS